MAVSFTNLDKNSIAVAASSFPTGSVTPVANNGVFLSFCPRLASGNGPLAATGVSGCNLTWTNVQSVNWGSFQGTATATRQEIWFGAGASPTTGAITMSFSTSPTTIQWAVDQSSGAASSFATAVGTIGVATALATATPATVTMPAFLHASSGTYGAMFVDHSGGSTGSGPGMTELGFGSGVLPSMETEFAAGNIATVQATFTLAAANWSIMGVEVMVPGAAGTQLHSLCATGAGS